MATSAVFKSQEDWEGFLKEAGIPQAEIVTYAKAIIENRIYNPADLTTDILKSLKILIIGDQLSIMKHAKVKDSEMTSGTKVAQSKSFKPKIDLPKISSEMTSAEFRKFRTDWSVYKSITQIAVDQVAPQLYTACTDTVQNHIINSDTKFFTQTEETCLSTIEKIVTRQANPAVHRLSFSQINQSENEHIKPYMVRLRSAAKDCQFECPACKHDLADTHIKDQLIRGISNTSLQTDILAKSASLQTLESIIKHAEAFETAVHDQSSLTNQHPSEAMRIQSEYKRAKSAAPWQSKPSLSTQPAKNYQTNKKQAYPCKGCGLHNHPPGDRQRFCPAWGVTCSRCGQPNHYARVCFSRRSSVKEIRSPHNDDNDHDQFLISHLELMGDSYTSVSSITIHEIPAQISLPGKAPVETQIFPDSGASICLAGTRHMDTLKINEKDLIPCSRKVMAVGGSVLTCKGYINACFTVGHKNSQQPLYICEKVDRIYFSRQACLDVDILHPNFPYPMTKEAAMAEIQSANSNNQQTSPKITENQRSRTPPCPLTEENIPQLKQHLMKEFASVFTRATPFPAMNCPPAHIHLKPDAVPYAVHSPIPVPIHWKEEAKKDLDRDVENGIIEPVPIGDPAIWCSPMIIVGKSDGRLRRTVDFQRLNSQCLRETHHSESPFKLASQIPPGKKKTVLDATGRISRHPPGRSQQTFNNIHYGVGQV